MQQCRRNHFYPRHACPHCWSDHCEWRAASGRGRIYSYTVIHHNDVLPFKEMLPYIVALVALEEGVRVTANIVEGTPEVMHIGIAPLRAVLFLEKSRENRLMALTEFRGMLGRLLACLIKPLATGDWWEKTLALAENIIREVSSSLLEFDLSGEIVSKLELLVQEAPPAGGGAR